MKKGLIFISFVCCFAFSLNLMANEVIKLTWSAISIGKGSYIYYKSTTIIATENKTFTVDWGDGSNIETKIGTGDKQILSHTYANTKGYTAIITGGSTDCLFSYLDCAYHGIMNLNIESAVSLKTLRCSLNGLKELDISHCPALEYLDCSENLLTKLDISTNTALKYLDCNSNDTWVNMQGHGTGISYLDFSNCKLTYLNCSYNSLSLSNLYAASEMISEIENKIFDNQTIPWGKTITGTPIDFSSEVEFGGIATVFDIKRDCDKIPAIEGADYTINEGIITFLTKASCNRGFIVTMTNEDIPTASVTTSFYVYDFMHLLSELTVSEGTLEPEFNSIIFNYTVYVGEDVPEITLSATPNNSNTIISGTGVKSLNLGENNFIVNALTWFSANEGMDLGYNIKVIRGTVGMTDIFQSSEIKIYPNPTQNQLRIGIAGRFPSNEQEVEIYSVVGQKLQSNIVNLQSEIILDVSHLANGMYFLKINNQIFKFVKK